jgi:hypothetical protein
LIGARSGQIHVTAPGGRGGRAGIALHRGRLHADDRTERDGIPVTPLTNVHLLGCEVDALWEEARLIVELDGWRSHRHRVAFERDRIRDADHAVAGYRVIRVTYRRLKAEPQLVAAQLRELLRGPDGRRRSSRIASGGSGARAGKPA